MINEDKRCEVWTYPAYKDPAVVEILFGIKCAPSTRISTSSQIKEQRKLTSNSLTIHLHSLKPHRKEVRNTKITSRHQKVTYTDQ